MNEEKTSPGLVWVVQVSSALSLGTLAGLLYSVKTVTPSIQFQFSGGAVLAFVLAAGASVAFWHIVFKLTDWRPVPGSDPDHRQTQGRKRVLLALAIVLGVGLLFAFIYPLKDFSSEKVREIGIGAFIALLFLTVLGVIFYRVVRYLEADPIGGK